MIDEKAHPEHTPTQCAGGNEHPRAPPRPMRLKVPVKTFQFLPHAIFEPAGRAARTKLGRGFSHGSIVRAAVKR